MLLVDISAQLIEDGALRFQLPGWRRSHYVIEPWRRGFTTRCVRGSTTSESAAWPLVVVPPPPAGTTPAIRTSLPGTDTIVPIRTLQELRAEAETQQNCVLGYAGDIEAGRVYLYRMLSPQRATLEIRLGQGGPKIGQLARARNRKVNAGTSEVVRSWFAAARRSVECNDDSEL